jgi:CRISPR-associated protein Cst2
MYHSLSVSGLLTLDLHALNNEGAEGNTMMTRMVDIIDREGKKHTVNAVSGDMFKHIFVEHLLGEAKREEISLCNGCKVFDPNRIQADSEFIGNKSYSKETLDSAILSDAVRRCVVDDCAGILITSEIGKKRSIARKSCVEFGWVVGRPEAVTTDSYFHAKYVPEGRGGGSGEAANLGQNIFHRPASSGQYAVVVNVDLYKVSRNDITLEHVLEEPERKKRMGALLRSLVSTVVKPTGAHRNTQNPHVVDFTGVIATSKSSVPAPTISAINMEYADQIQGVADALNTLNGVESAISVRRFESLAGFTGEMVKIIAQVAS